MRPLEDILVVSIEQAVAAPVATSRLADAGARVIKLEREEGDFARGYDECAKGQSSYFVWANRGKESCRVDLKLEEDRNLLLSILADADVFMQNLGPGAIARLNFGHEHLHTLFPKLITCDIVGFSSDTPDFKRKAYDLLIQAETGLSAITGSPESGPTRVGVSICDVVTGHAAYAAILEALISRQQSGKGMHLEVSLFDTMADIMNVPYLQHEYGGVDVKRVGLSHPTIAPYGAFKCSDGEIVISIQNDTEWKMFCSEILDRVDLGQDPRYSTNALRVKNRATIDQLIQAVFSKMPIDALIADLRDHRIANGRISSLKDLANHSAAAFLPIQTPNGVVDVLAPPVRRDGKRPILGAVPALGAHDASVRSEFSDPLKRLGAAK